MKKETKYYFSFLLFVLITLIVIGLLTPKTFGQINVTRTNCPVPLLPNQIIILQSIAVYQGVTTAILGCYQFDGNFLIDTTTTPPTLRVNPSGGSDFIFIDSEVPQGTIDGFNHTFSLNHNPLNGSLHIYRNGIRYTPIVDYTIVNNIVLFSNNDVPQTGDNLVCDYRY